MGEDNFDIYGDLDEALIEPLEEVVSKKKVIEIAKEEEDKKFQEKTEKTLLKLQKDNKNLKANISLLLSTAKSEIDRKDLQIKQLRRELDDYLFRKNKAKRSTTNEKFTQTYPNGQTKCTQTTYNVKDTEQRLSLRDKRDRTPERTHRNCGDSHHRSRDRHDERRNNNRNDSPERNHKRDKSRHRNEHSDRKSSKDRHSSSRDKELIRSKSKSPKRERNRHHREDEPAKKERKSSREDSNKKLHHENKSDKEKKSTKIDDKKLKLDENDLRKKLLKKNRDENVEKSEKSANEELCDKKEEKNNDITELVNHTEKEDEKILKNLMKEDKIASETETPIIEVIENLKEQPPLPPIESTTSHIEEPPFPPQEIVPSHIEEPPQEPTSTQIEESLQSEEIIYEEKVFDAKHFIIFTDTQTIQEMLDEKQPLEIEQVPLEVDNDNHEEIILQLPLNNADEEVIFDSRNLIEKSPIKSPTNESFDSTKENSMNNSLNKSSSPSSTTGKSRKRKIVTKEVETDGSVVFTITRKKKRKIAKS